MDAYSYSANKVVRFESGQNGGFDTKSGQNGGLARGMRGKYGHFSQNVRNDGKCRKLTHFRHFPSILWVPAK